MSIFSYEKEKGGFASTRNRLDLLFLEIEEQNSEIGTSIQNPVDSEAQSGYGRDNPDGYAVNYQPSDQA
jgi:hypothetical protein